MGSASCSDELRAVSRINLTALLVRTQAD